MRTSVYIATSLDGFIARVNGDLDWLDEIEHPEGVDYGHGEFMASVDTLVMGRGTYDKVRSFDVEWPYEVPVVVLSSGTVDIPDDLADRVSATSLGPAELLTDLEGQGVSHVYLDGGLTISSFMRAKLVDQLIITTIPVLLGHGIPLFSGVGAQVDLELVGVESYDNGLVKSTYNVGRAPQEESP